MKNQTLVLSMNLPQGNGESYYLPLNGGDSGMNDDGGGDWRSGPPLPQEDHMTRIDSLTVIVMGAALSPASHALTLS
jgi:hypothetical protein